MEWNFKNLSAALGCFDRPFNWGKDAKASYDLNLVIEDGNDGKYFALYDLYSEDSDPELFEKYDNIAHVYGELSGTTTIEFKKGGYVTIRTPRGGRKILFLDLDHYTKKCYYRGESKMTKSLEIKEDIRIPGTNILLEKGDKVYIKGANISYMKVLDKLESDGWEFFYPTTEYCTARKEELRGIEIHVGRNEVRVVERQGGGWKVLWKGYIREFLNSYKGVVDNKVIIGNKEF